MNGEATRGAIRTPPNAGRLHDSGVRSWYLSNCAICDVYMHYSGILSGRRNQAPGNLPGAHICVLANSAVRRLRLAVDQRLPHDCWHLFVQPPGHVLLILKNALAGVSDAGLPDVVRRDDQCLV